ncbi:MAG: helix-turn-helix domain-containing protein [Treponema sp.]|nr:helix-turn-helix domain-containing protein [Treponema sp.]
MTGKDLRAILSYNIKRYRGNHGWSQADLAEKANISIAFLSNIERGVKWPYPDTIVKIAKALKVEEFELFRQNEGKIDDTATLIDRFVMDISISVSDSISKTYRQYFGKEFSASVDETR